MIRGLIFILAVSSFYLVFVAPGSVVKAVRKRRRIAVSVTEMLAAFDVAAAEREVSRPLAELIAEAERKAIAMHSPLPRPIRHEMEVVANPVKTAEVTSLVGGGVSHVPIEVTAIGDRMPMYLYPGESVIRPARPEIYLLARPEIYLLGRRATLIGQAKWITEHDPCNTGILEPVIAEIEVINRRLEAIARCRRNTTSGPGKRSPQSKRQTGHTPEPG